MNRSELEALLHEVTVGLVAEQESAVSRGRGGPSATLDVVAMGKAATPLLRGLRGQLARAIVVLPDGAPAPASDPRITVLRGAHPLPDERSVAAGRAALELAANGSASELVIVVSGGASSLAFVPVDGVPLQTARELFRTLLLSGADVREINVVRRHLSRVHGGGLASATTRPTYSFIASDVIGGAPHDVGSGPGVPDPTTVDDARAVLARRAPAFLSIPLRETLKEPGSQGVGAEIVLEPTRLAEALGEALQRKGHRVRLLSPSTGSVTDLAAEYAEIARTMGEREAMVRVAEPSVRVDAASPGSGGRCTHLAALVACDLPPGVTFVAAASDGVDGTSGTAGAIVDNGSFPDRAALDAALAAFDTGPLHLHAGTALPSVPTGLNLTDVHVLVRG